MPGIPIYRFEIGTNSDRKVSAAIFSALSGTPAGGTIFSGIKARKVLADDFVSLIAFDSERYRRLKTQISDRAAVKAICDIAGDPE